MALKLDPKEESDRLEIATQLYERFCHDLAHRSDSARVRLVSGIQVALRDAASGNATELVFPSPGPVEARVGRLEELVSNLDPAGRPGVEWKR